MPPCPTGPTRVLLAVADVVKNAAGEKDRLLLHQAPQHDANSMAYHGTGWNRMASQNRIVQCLPCYWMLLESLPAKPFEVCGTSQEITPRLLTSSHASAFLIIFRHPSALSASVAKFANDIVTQSDSYYCRRDAIFPDLGGCRNTHPQSKHAVEVHLGTVPLEVQGSDVMPIKQHTVTQRIIEALKQCHLELWSKFY